MNFDQLEEVYELAESLGYEVESVGSRTITFVRRMTEEDTEDISICTLWMNYDFSSDNFKLWYTNLEQQMIQLAMRQDGLVPEPEYPIPVRDPVVSMQEAYNEAQILLAYQAQAAQKQVAAVNGYHLPPFTNEEMRAMLRGTNEAA